MEKSTFISYCRNYIAAKREEDNDQTQIKDLRKLIDIANFIESENNFSEMSHAMAATICETYYIGKDSRDS
ncbi:hypothetical protein GOV14_01735 [Candidatus Pacearchaeota archaeon]|nr:hypothetical protein [Candidatus Pacearchaeota archaeon]